MPHVANSSNVEVDGSLIVTHGDVICGIFTERDALKLMARGGDVDAAGQPVPDSVAIRAWRVSELF